MTDWAVYEFEDIIWNGLGDSDDHIVPRPGGKQVKESVAQGDFHKKQRHVACYFGRSMDSIKSVSKNVFLGKEDTSFYLTSKDMTVPMRKNGSSWSHTSDRVFPASGDTDCFREVTGVPSKDSDNCFKNSNIDSAGNEFCTDALLGNTGGAIDSNLCRFQLDDISSGNTGLKFFRNEHEEKGNSDLLDYGWPAIGNFEDVDRLFRNCDSTFGEESTNNTDELSWFSSSLHNHDDPEDALKADLTSLHTELSAKWAPKHHEADMEFMPDSDSPLVNCCCKNSKVSSQTSDYCNCSNWGDADETKVEPAPEEEWVNTSEEETHEGNGKDEVSILSLTHISNKSSLTGCQGTDSVNVQRRQSKCQNQPEKKRNDQSSEYLSGSSLCGPSPVQQFATVEFPASRSLSQQVFPSQGLPRETKLFGHDSLSYLHTHVPYVHLDYNHPSNQSPLTPTTSSVSSEEKSHPFLSYTISAQASNHSQQEERSPDPSPNPPSMTPEQKIEKLRLRKQLRAALTTESRHQHFECQTALTDQAPLQKQPLHQVQNVGGDNEGKGLLIQIPVVESDSTVQENSRMSSVLSDEISLEATSFWQLRNVLEKLDIGTKLCIRDSLYRLAKSADHRNNAGNTNKRSRDGRNKTGFMEEEESDKLDQSRCGSFMDVEADTNPIDRSIAHLLFHRPSEQTLGSYETIS